MNAIELLSSGEIQLLFNKNDITIVAKDYNGNSHANITATYLEGKWILDSSTHSMEVMPYVPGTKPRKKQVVQFMIDEVIRMVRIGPRR